MIKMSQSENLRDNEPNFITKLVSSLIAFHESIEILRITIALKMVHIHQLPKLFHENDLLFKNNYCKGNFLNHLDQKAEAQI